MGAPGCKLVTLRDILRKVFLLNYADKYMNKSILVQSDSKLNIHYHVQNIAEKLKIMFKLFSHISNCEITASREELLLVMTPNERAKEGETSKNTKLSGQDNTMALYKDLPVPILPIERAFSLGTN